MRGLLNRFGSRRVMTAFVLMLQLVLMPLQVVAGSSQTISLNVQNAPLGDVLRLIALQAGENLVADDSVSAIHVSLRLANVGYDQALQVLAQAYGLVIRHEHGVVIVGTAANLRRRMEDQAEGDEQVTTVKLRYARAADAVKHLQVFLPERCFTADLAQNAIVLIGGGVAIARARAVLRALDVRNQQVRIEVKVVDVNLDHESTVGTLFGNAGGSPGSVAVAFQAPAVPLSATVNGLVVRGKAKVLASPRLLTVNNTEAVLLIGESYPLVSNYTVGNTTSQDVRYIDVGVKLRLTPTIGSDGSILVDLHPEYSAFASQSQAGYPIIQNRHVDTTLRVKNNETIVLAGLLEDINSDTVTKMPLLGDLPVFGPVFRNRTRKHVHDEIIFIITPHVE